MSFLIKYRVAIVIALLFIIRLYGIQHPPLEVNHHWRQVTGLMVARNYHEGNTDFFHPMIDDIGVGESASSGVVGMEFPALNYVYASISNIFGYEHWYGRLIILILSSLGLWWFYLLLKEWKDSFFAFIGMVLLGCSIWFAFSRKFMPDVASISLAIGALLYGVRYMRGALWSNLILYGLLASLAMLIKIPAAIVLSGMLIMLFQKEIPLKKKIIIVVMSIIPISVTCWWYFVWNVKLSQESGIWYNSGESFGEGLHTVLDNLDLVASNFYFSVTMSYVALSLVLLGIFRAIQRKEVQLLALTTLVFGVFFLYAIKSGRHFVFQHYYMIPLAPLYAVLATSGLISIIQKKAMWLLFTVICVESLANQAHDFRIHNRNLYKMRLESIVGDHIPQNALVVINGEGNPQELYLAHRKGWVCTSAQLDDATYLNKVKSAGARYVVVNKHRYLGRLVHKSVYEDEDYIIFDLKF
jgi:hypothetical protein